MKLISGLQTGADIAGIKAAKANNIETGGHMPKGFRTEIGSKPEYADLYNAKECHSSNYLERTELNVKQSDCTIIFDYKSSSGSRQTKRYCQQHNKKYLYLTDNEINKFESCVSLIVSFLENFQFDNLIVNIAGNRESVAHGIEKRVYKILDNVFKKLNL